MFWPNVCMRIEMTQCVLRPLPTRNVGHMPWSSYDWESFAIIVVLTALIPCVNVRMNRSKRQKRNSNQFSEPTEQHIREKNTEISFYTWTVKQSSSSRGLSLYLSLGAYGGRWCACERTSDCVCMCVNRVCFYSRFQSNKRYNHWVG